MAEQDPTSYDLFLDRVEHRDVIVSDDIVEDVSEEFSELQHVTITNLRLMNPNSVMRSPFKAMGLTQPEVVIEHLYGRAAHFGRQSFYLLKANHLQDFVASYDYSWGMHLVAEAVNVATLNQEGATTFNTTKLDALNRYGRVLGANLRDITDSQEAFLRRNQVYKDLFNEDETGFKLVDLVRRSIIDPDVLPTIPVYQQIKWTEPLVQLGANHGYELYTVTHPLYTPQFQEPNQSRM